jgi:hypothetical protein
MPAFSCIAIEIVGGAESVKIRTFDFHRGLGNLNLKTGDSICFPKIVCVTPRFDAFAMTKSRAALATPNLAIRSG